MFRSSGQNIQLRSSFVSAGCSSSLCIPGGVKGAAELDRFLQRESAQNTMHLKLSVCVWLCVFIGQRRTLKATGTSAVRFSRWKLSRGSHPRSVCVWRLHKFRIFWSSQKNLLFWRRLSNRCKVSWRLLLPERLAKLVSMNYELWFCEDVTWWVRGAISGDFMLSGWLQYQSRTLRRQRRATRSLERPARRAAR